MANFATDSQGVSVTVGRAPDNDFVVGDLGVAHHHAAFTLDPDGCWILHLNRRTRALVDGQPVGANTAARQTFRPGRASATATPLPDGSTVRIGTATFEVSSDGIAQIHHSDRDFVASDLMVIKDDRTILSDVSFVVPPRSLVAVIGPSGAGKTTLLNALTGVTPADSGDVTYGGVNIYDDPAAIRRTIGLVPQEDLLHSTLTVQRALALAAQLRFAPDTTSAEVAARIDEVLATLGLTAHRHKRVDRLSGGQRKRTSVAIELLTRPQLLFLDEPTSGLDPGLDLQVMRTLARLAHEQDAQRTVFVVTHSVTNIDECDLVMLFTLGGRMAYFGPPGAQLCAQFDAATYAEVFTRVAADEDGSMDPHLEHAIAALDVIQELAVSDHEELPAVQISQPAPVPLWRQFSILTRRQIAVLASDRKVLALLVLLPLVLGLLGMLVGGTHGLGTYSVSGVPVPFTANGQARALVLFMLMSVTLLGLASTTPEIAREVAIYRRERSVGVSRVAYLAAKTTVFVVIVAAQTLCVALMTMWRRPWPSDPPVAGSYGSILIPLMMLGAVCALLGLWISALARRPERTMMPLVAATLVLVVLSGGFMLRLPDALNWLQLLVPSSWAHDALASAVSPSGAPVVPSSPAEWTYSAHNWWRGVRGTFAFAPIAAVLTWTAVRALDAGRPSLPWSRHLSRRRAERRRAELEASKAEILRNGDE